MKYKFLICILFLFIITGCRKNIDDYSEITEAENIQNTPPDYISDTIVRNDLMCEVIVEASVCTKNIARGECWEVKSINIDDLYLQHLATVLFDDGKYEWIKPYETCLPDELNDEEEFIESLMGNCSAFSAGTSFQLFEIRYFMEKNKNESEKEIISDDGFICTVEYEYEINETESFLVQYQTCRLRGNIFGQAFELYFFSDTQSQLLRIMPYIQSEGFDDVFIGEHLSYSDENLCDFQQAKEQTERLLQCIPEQSLEIGYYEERYCFSENNVLCADGYRFYCVPTFNDISNFSGPFFLAGNMLNQNMLMVDVDQYGLCKLQFSPAEYELGTYREYVDLLPFTKIYEYAYDFMNTTRNMGYQCWATEVNSFRNVKVTEIAFSGITGQKENMYINTPAWVFYIEDVQGYDQLGKRRVPWFAVNAIDGTVYLIQEIKKPEMFPYDFGSEIETSYREYIE